MRDVIAQKTHRKHPPAPSTAHASRGMEREHVETYGIARFECPAENPVPLALCFNIRQVGERAFREPAGLGIHEGTRHEPGPQMGACHELQRRLPCHRIHRNPEAAVLPSFDVVVGLILMPGRALARAGLLGQHVIVVEPRAVAAHQTAGYRRQGRFEYEAPVLPVFLPVAEILDELARVIRAARDLGTRAGLREVGVDPFAQLLDLCRTEQATHADRTVPLEVADQIPGERKRFSRAVQARQ